MYSLKPSAVRNVSCNATRREKHSNMRKTYVEQRRTQDKNIRSTFGSLAKDERQRVSSIWEAHKEFFARDNKKESEDKTIEPIVVDSEDLDSSNGFFEATKD